jgi:hypothetical protein
LAALFFDPVARDLLERSQLIGSVSAANMFDHNGSSTFIANHLHGGRTGACSCRPNGIHDAILILVLHRRNKNTDFGWKTRDFRPKK